MEQAFCPRLFRRSPPRPSSHTPLLYPGFKFVFKSLPKPCSHISPFYSSHVSRRLHIFLLFWPVHLTQTMKGRRIYLGSWFPRCWSIVGGGCGEVRSSRHGCQEAEKYNRGRKLSTISPQKRLLVAYFHRRLGFLGGSQANHIGRQDSPRSLAIF